MKERPQTRIFSMAVTEKLYERIRKEAFKKKESISAAARRLLHEALITTE